MLLGLRTAIYHVDDIEKAKNWYSSILGFGPYFDEPFYVGFNVGGYELGLQPDEADRSRQAEGVVAYWVGRRKRRGFASETSRTRGYKARRYSGCRRGNQSGDGQGSLWECLWDH